MPCRQAAVATLLCIAVAATIGGLIAIIWHVIPEQYALLVRWIAYGLICIGVQCGCLLVRCLCIHQADSWCPAVDHAVTPGGGGGGGAAAARRSAPTARAAGGAVLDPDDKPPAYSQVIYEEGQPPPPFLDAVRRESMDEALQAETEAEFLREALQTRQAVARRAEMEARRAAELSAEADTSQQEKPPAESETELHQSDSSRASAGVGCCRGEAEDCHTEAEVDACRTEVPEAGAEAGQSKLEDDVFEDNENADTADALALPPSGSAAENPEDKTEGDILLEEAIRAEAASKALLAECTMTEAHQPEESRTETAATQSPKTDTDSACIPVVTADSAVHVSSSTSAAADLSPERTTP